MKMKISTEVINIYDCCPMCGMEHSFALTIPELLRLDDGQSSIQEKFPYLAKQEREFLITGYCLDCQEKLFGSKYTDKRNSARWDADDTEPLEVEAPDDLGSLFPQTC